MNINERMEFHYTTIFLSENKINSHIQNTINNYSDFRTNPRQGKNVYESVEMIRKYLEYLNKNEIVCTYLKKASHPTIFPTIIEFNDSLETFIKAASSNKLLKILEDTKSSTFIITKYNNYLSNFDTKNLIEKIKNSIAFTYQIGKTVNHAESIKRMDNINNVFKLVNILLGEDEDFEIIHVEDGSFRTFVTASLITINLISPLVETITESMTNIIELLNKIDIQKIEREIKEEELRHLRSMNQKEEHVEEIKIDAERIELIQKKYKRKLEALEQELTENIEYQILVLNKRYSNDFKHKDNPEKLLKEISNKIEDHCRNSGHIKTYLEYNELDAQKEKKFKTLLSQLSHEQLEQLEGPIINANQADEKE